MGVGIWENPINSLEIKKKFSEKVKWPVQYSKNTGDNTQWTTLENLGEIREPEVETLIKMLKSEDLIVREGIVKVLVEIGELAVEPL